MKDKPLTQVLSKEQQHQLADWVTTLTLAITNKLANEHFRKGIRQGS